MKNRISSYLVNPPLIIFGLVIFNLIWVYFRSEWHFHQNIFLATWLLISSVMLVLNRTWSNLAAMLFSSYLPNALVFEFWMFARNAEVPPFSGQHFRFWFASVRNIDKWPLLCLILSIAMLWCASASIMRSIRQRNTSHDAEQALAADSVESGGY